jgi:hypothetical protein
MTNLPKPILRLTVRTTRKTKRLFEGKDFDYLIS